MDIVSLVAALIGGVSAAVVNGLMNWVSASKTEKLRAALSQAMYEYQTRFSGLHAKRLEATADVYALLRLTEMSFQNMTARVSRQGEPSDAERIGAYNEDARAFVTCFYTKRVLLHEALCQSIEEFIKTLRSGASGHEWWLAESTTDEHKITLYERVDKIKESLGPMIGRIEQEMRNLLEALPQQDISSPTPRHAAGRGGKKS